MTDKEQNAEMNSRNTNYLHERLKQVNKSSSTHVLYVEEPFHDDSRVQIHTLRKDSTTESTFDALRELRPLFIVDIDGTLVDNSPRRHLVPTEDQHIPASWSPFNLACGLDIPITRNIITVKALIDGGYLPIFVTSRGADARRVTENQLRDIGLTPHPLVMRPMDEQRKPAEWKSAVIDTIENYYGYKVAAAIDDDHAVCAMMRDRGIAVAQVRSNDHTVQGNY